MTDIVERLRSIGRECVALGYASLRHNYCDAADEIERLRRELAEARVLLRALRGEVHVADIGDCTLLSHIDAALAGEEKP